MFFEHVHHLRNNGFASFVLRDSKQAGRNGTYANHKGVGVSESVAPLIPNLKQEKGTDDFLVPVTLAPTKFSPLPIE